MNLLWVSYYDTFVSQSIQLHDELKRALREAQTTYAEVADALELSEASIKRLFSTRSLSIDRMEQVCRLIGIELFELMQRVEQRREYISAMTPEQEEALVADPKLLLMTYSVIHGRSVDEICRTYNISESEAQRMLVQLDRLKVIELLPFNRVRRLTARNFSWRKDGPVQRFFKQQVQADYFASDFGGASEDLKLLAGALSQQAVQRVRAAMERFAREFDEIVGEDTASDPKLRSPSGVVLALRPWEPKFFSRLQRPVAEDE